MQPQQAQNPAARDAMNASAAFDGRQTAPAPAPFAPQTFVPGGFAPGGHRQAPLTLAEMHALVAGGESVLYNNRIINDARHLPTEAQLALGDPAKEQAAALNMQRQIEKLQADLDALKAGRLAAPGPAPGVGPGSVQAETIKAMDAAGPGGPRPNAADPTRLTPEQTEEIKEAQRRALVESQRRGPAQETP